MVIFGTDVPPIVACAAVNEFPPVKFTVGDDMVVVVEFCPNVSVFSLPFNNTHPEFADVLVAKIKFVRKNPVRLVTDEIVKLVPTCDMVDGPTFAVSLINI